MLVLLDRDGVINEDLPTGVNRWEDFKFVPGSLKAIARLTKAGYKIAVCTNQSAIGKGLLTEEGFTLITRNMLKAVEEAGGKIHEVYHAPEAPDFPSLRRKPAPGMLREALTKFGAAASKTPFVGDMQRDMEAARAAGCPRILTRSGKGKLFEAQGIPGALEPLTIVDDLDAAVTHILTHYAGA